MGMNTALAGAVVLTPFTWPPKDSGDVFAEFRRREGAWATCMIEAAKSPETRGDGVEETVAFAQARCKHEETALSEFVAGNYQGSGGGYLLGDGVQRVLRYIELHVQILRGI